MYIRRVHGLGLVLGLVGTRSYTSLLLEPNVDKISYKLHVSLAVDHR